MKISSNRFVQGDNLSKPIDIYVDEVYKTWDVYLYFKPVEGDETYMSADTIPLDADNHGEYSPPGEVCNGVGYFRAQIICLGPNGEIAKSGTFNVPCQEAIDDNSAILPTGEVITLAQFKAQLDAISDELNSLDAADVGYTDTEGLGLDNVQDAIDYALTHGSSTQPVYELTWDPAPSPALIAANLEVINTFRGRAAGSYDVMLNTGSTQISATQISVTRGNPNAILLYFVNYENENYALVTFIRSSSTANYSQGTYSTIEIVDFDPMSDKAASMFAIAGYVDTRIGTTGDLDPSSFASASDVDAIESKIPSAASSSNKLVDADSLASAMPHFRLEWYDAPSQTQRDANLAVLDAVKAFYTTNNYLPVVELYDHEINTLAVFDLVRIDGPNVTAEFSALTNANVYNKYYLNLTVVMPNVPPEYSQNKSEGIPKESLSASVQASLGKADTALQSVPAGYATETYVNTAIAAAIGDAIGGSY